MPLPRDERPSSPSSTLVIAVLVVCLLLLAAFLLLVLGAFYFSFSAARVPNVQQTPVATADSPAFPNVEAAGEGERKTIESAPQTGRPRDATEPDAAGGSASVPDETTTEDAASEEPSDAAPASPGAQSLAALTPSEIVDVQVGGQPLVRPVQIQGRTHRSAIWAQPVEDRGSCQISFVLERKYATVRGSAAIADPAVPPDAGAAAAEEPKAAFRIYGDGNLLWDSGTLTGHGSSREFRLDVSRIGLLALVAESDSPESVSRLTWVDAELTPVSP